MKKAKLILSSIAVFAVIGGAFAFKATRLTNTFYSAPNTAAACTIPFATTYTVTNVGTLTKRWSTAFTTAPCPTITVRTTL